MAKAPIMKSAELEPKRKIRLYDLLSTLAEQTRIAAAANALADKAKEDMIAEFFPKLSEGTNNVDLEFGKKLVLKYPIYRKADAAVLDTLLANRAIPAELYNRVIKNEPSVIVGGWKAATVDERKLLADAVTESPGKVGFSIEDKKS